MNLYKARLLGFIEYRTPAVYHAAGSLLQQIDGIQGRFLSAIGITKKVALMEFRLAPLNARRDMGMLGLIHRTVIGEGPKQFAKFFVRAPLPIRTHGRSALRCHRRQLITHRKGPFLEILRNSVLGLVDVYNMLPVYIADAPTVKLFQRRLQELLVTCVWEQVGEWWNVFSTR